jgi:hypothetical protein
MAGAAVNGKTRNNDGRYSGVPLEARQTRNAAKKVMANIDVTSPNPT